MHLVYYDESGDDGMPGSSPLFVLSAFYCEVTRWRENFINFREFRRELSREYKFPTKWEMHTTQFILNKRPFRELGLDDETRIHIIGQFCDRIATLDAKIVNVVINKQQATRFNQYNVLDRALTYSIQRIENDMRKTYSSDTFMMITDPGRLPSMRKTSRRLQAINYIPSQFGHQSYRKDITLLIEDPLQKILNSLSSFRFRFVARLIYMYKLLDFGKALSNRTPTQITNAAIRKLA
ncbi:MAG: DUF3800 domain-containing protein [Ardenticatenaceae bacterium]|nr:DUF3800 domain-containing protein [Ardenticatenaceae bacterium]